MRILFVVQRQGEMIAGGAEHLVRELAQRLCSRGNQVEVLTSCATSYADWADQFEAGTSTEEGVTLHRHRVDHQRNNDRFGPLHDRTLSTLLSGGRCAPVVQDRWAHDIGPSLYQFERVLEDLAVDTDVVVFSGYMFTTTTTGLPRLAGRRPTVLLSLAHDEPALRLGPVARAVRLADAIICLTEEERELIALRFRPRSPCEVVGAGLDPPQVGVSSRTLAKYSLDPAGGHLVSVGRIDPAKGVMELVSFHQEATKRNPSTPPLVLVGSEVAPVPRSPGLVVTGFVPPHEKWDLVGTASLLIQPSYFESFSYSLMEGWQLSRAALVQRRCEVLAGHVARSGGGMTYASFSEFDASLQMLLSNPAARLEMGEHGARYTEQFLWDPVVTRVEAMLSSVVGMGSVERSGGLR